jgi:hypothetical protein
MLSACWSNGSAKLDSFGILVLFVTTTKPLREPSWAGPLHTRYCPQYTIH